MSICLPHKTKKSDFFAEAVLMRTRLLLWRKYILLSWGREAAWNSGCCHTVFRKRMCCEGSEVSVRQTKRVRSQDIHSGLRESLSPQHTESERESTSVKSSRKRLMCIMIILHAEFRHQVGLCHRFKVYFLPTSCKGSSWLRRQDTNRKERFFGWGHHKDVIFRLVLRFSSCAWIIHARCCLKGKGGKEEGTLDKMNEEVASLRPSSHS